jgi:hypothetical protein
MLFVCTILYIGAAVSVALVRPSVRWTGATRAKEYPSRLVSQHPLAMAYEADGQVGKAVELLEHVVAVEAKILRDGHPSSLVSQETLADLYDELEAAI